MTQTVELPARRQNRRHPLEWKRSVVDQTSEPGASVSRVARDNNINANQMRAWRKLYAQGLLVEDEQTETMLPVVVDVQSGTRCESHRVEVEAELVCSSDACPHAPRQTHGHVNEGRRPITLNVRGRSCFADAMAPLGRVPPD
ncbi:transposase [Paraburkholderia sp.]|uniref:transposase n=1 Tax=Paraburkholderia sp. TaxID=1926495 RepID=UPI003C727DE9